MYLLKRRIGLPWIVFLMFISCSHRHKEVEKSIFKYNDASGITSLDPLKANNLSNIWAVQQLFNGLVQLDSGLNVTPCLAKYWTISDDGLTYTFHLRNDVFFHEDLCFGGEHRKLKASDVVFSFNRIHNQNGPQWVIQCLERKEDGSLFIESMNDTIVQFHLKYPFVQFLQVLTIPYAYIVSEDAVNYYGDNFGFHPVGTGPFSFRKWHHNEKLILNKNELYFEKDENGISLPYLDGVAITFIKDKQTASLEFKEGRCDIISGLDPAYKDELLTPFGTLNPDYSTKAYLQKIPYLNTEYLGFNQDLIQGTAMENVDFRKALSLAIDRSQLITYIRNGIGIPAYHSFTPPVLLNVEYSMNEVDDRQIKKQKIDSLLKNAGFNEGEELPQFTLFTDPAYVDLSTALISQWESYGFNIRLNVLDRPTLKSKVSKGQLEFFRASWIADYPEAENYISLFYSQNFSPVGPNYTHFKNNRVDSLYKELLRNPDDKHRKTLALMADSIVMDQQPVIPLFYDELTRFIRIEISGLPPHPMNHLDLRRVKKASLQK